MDVASLYSVAPDYIAQSYGQNRAVQASPFTYFIYYILHILWHFASLPY